MKYTDPIHFHRDVFPKLLGRRFYYIRANELAKCANPVGRLQEILEKPENSDMVSVWCNNIAEPMNTIEQYAKFITRILLKGGSAEMRFEDWMTKHGFHCQKATALQDVHGFDFICDDVFVDVKNWTAIAQGDYKPKFADVCIVWLYGDYWYFKHADSLHRIHEISLQREDNISFVEILDKMKKMCYTINTNEYGQSEEKEIS